MCIRDRLAAAVKAQGYRQRARKQKELLAEGNAGRVKVPYSQGGAKALDVYKRQAQRALHLVQQARALYRAAAVAQKHLVRAAADSRRKLCKLPPAKKYFRANMVIKIQHMPLPFHVPGAPVRPQKRRVCPARKGDA